MEADPDDTSRADALQCDQEVFSMSVFVIGSMNIDSIYEVPHFVRPGETLACHSLEIQPGGKGLNQAIAASRAGSSTRIAGCRGKNGQFLQDLLKENGVDTSLVSVHPSVPSGEAVIQRNAEGENCILISHGANHTLTEEQLESWLDQTEEDDVLLLQNEINHLDVLLDKAADKQLRVILNPAPMTGDIRKLNLQFLECLVLNESEAADLLQTSVEEDDEVLSSLCRQYGCPILMTLGAKGAFYYSDEQRWFAPVYPSDVLDTTGAGDTFCGYFAAGLDQGLSIQEALDMASAAASLSIEKTGASHSIPLKDEVVNRMEEHPEIRVLPQL